MILRSQKFTRSKRNTVFSIKVHFPKLDVAGSIPISRSWFQDLKPSSFPAVSVCFQNSFVLVGVPHMERNVIVVTFLLLMIGVIVSVDFLFFRRDFWVVGHVVGANSTIGEYWPVLNRNSALSAEKHQARSSPGYRHSVN
jgi:hypothetical protein